jgi:hypothetical protein
MSPVFPRLPAVYQPVEKCLPGIFQPRQVRSKAPHGSQNNDLGSRLELTYPTSIVFDR